MTRSRISTRRRVTIPTDVLKAAGLEVGDVVNVEAVEPGVLRLRRVENPFAAAAGTLTGAFAPGYLAGLRHDWD
jgi:bifunctional DNA-binding transcriptional regulator/antitoxin component of YhaV-PrlF toxin-antitoxin module